MNLFLYSTLGTDWGLDIVPHWVEHYLALGVPAARFRLVLHSRQDQAPLAKARALLAPFHITPQFEWTGEFSSGENYKIRQRVWRECPLERDDWFLIADSDEFHHYDAPLHEFYSMLNASGHNALEARMIDRVAADGALAPISSQSPLDEQFPSEANITETLLKMNTLKIIAHKRDSFSGQLHRANHGIAPEFQSTAKIYRNGCCVAHYKWTEGVLEYLESRIDHYYDIGRLTDARKNEEFVAMVRKHGRLPLEELAVTNTCRS